MPGYAIAAIIIGAVIAVLCIPIKLLFSFDSEEEPSFRFRPSWFFGIIGREGSGQCRKSAGERRGASTGFSAGVLWKIIQREKVLEGFLRFIRDVYRVCRFKDIDADMRFGLGDPADTALLFAAVGLPAKFICSSLPYRVNIEPAFSEEALIAGHFYLVLRLRPVQITVPFLRLCLSMGIPNLMGIMTQFKWKRKNS